MTSDPRPDAAPLRDGPDFPASNPEVPRPAGPDTTVGLKDAEEHLPPPDPVDRPDGDSDRREGAPAMEAPTVHPGIDADLRHSRRVVARPGVRRSRLELVAFGIVLALAAALRFTGVNWDNGHQLHPDERFLFMVEGAIRTGLVTPNTGGAGDTTRDAPIWRSYFDTARSGLNPHNVGYGFFVYGTFPLFVTKAVLSALQGFGIDRIHIVGRSLSAASDVLSVCLVVAIARRLFGTRVALLAAILVATCVLHIQQSHFFVFESFLVTLVLATFWQCLDIVAHARWRDFAAVGVLVGLTLATKLSMVVFMPVIALAGLIHLLATPPVDLAGGTQALGSAADGMAARGASGGIDAAIERLAGAWRDGRLATIIAGGILVAIVALVTFRVAQPYAFAGPGPLDVRLNPRWLDNIDYQAKSQSGEVDLPPSIQWANTTPVIFPLRHMVVWGLGIPLGVVSLGAIGVAAWLALARGRWPLGLVAFWAALCLLYFSSVLNKTMRYLLPAYPFLIILGAWAIVAAIDASTRAWRSRSGGLASAGSSTASGRAGGGILSRPEIAGVAIGASWATALIVIAWSAGWAFAFTRIYTRPVSRGTASAWIYANVVPPVPLANEHWDDPLPLPMPGRDHSRYAGPQLPLYDPDEPRKIDTLVQMLSQSAYLNMTSNRLYGSIPRMPERYPMSTEYYRRLFAGELGFTHVATIASYPTLGPWTIVDDTAEEAFTVYDHPKVLIFKRDADFSAARVREVLSAVPLEGIRNIPPIMAGRPTLSLDQTAREGITDGGTWRDAFDPSGFEQAVAPLLWYLVISVMGLVAAPVLWASLPSLPERGYSIARTIGLLAVSWVGWWFSSTGAMPWTRLTLVLAFAACAVVTALAVRRHGRAWLGWLGANWRLVVTSELVFGLAFAGFCVIRAYNPDLWHPARGGEKPMEFAYLNAVIRTASFPPYDPWYAGGYLNYYYFGYVLVAAVTKLTGIVPSIAFNLAVPTVFALTAAGAFSAASNLAMLGASGAGRTPTWRLGIAGGIFGVAFAVVAGNLDAFGQLVSRLASAASSAGAPGLANVPALLAGLPSVLVAGVSLEGFDFWRSSRVIPNNVINEFPFWTFLFSDLHAHMISLAFQVATLVVLVAVASGRASVVEAGTGSLVTRFRGVIGVETIGTGLALGWLVGALNVINTWEYPTYLGLAAIAVGIRQVAPTGALTPPGVARVVATLGTMIASASLWYRPFWSHNLTVYSSVSPWTTDKSSLADYLVIHGAMVFQLVAFIALFGWSAWRRTVRVRWLLLRVRRSDAWVRLDRLEAALGRADASGWGVSAIVTAIAGTLAAFAWIGGLGLVGVLVLLAGAMVSTSWERRANPAVAFAGALGATGAVIGTFVEFFAISGDIGRMNTVFKFYLQVWVMWSVLAGATGAWVGARMFSSTRFAPIRWWEWAWATGGTALGLAILAYPLGAIPARLSDRFAPLPPTLDGMAYMRTATVHDASSEVTPANPNGATIRAFADRAAIDWLLANVEGTPVVLEASVPEYRWGSRISKYTGLPSVLGWRWHQAQQRGPYAPQVDARLRDVQLMFNAPQATAVTTLLDRYQVRYVYLGDLERAYYTAPGIAKFGTAPELFRRVYEADGVEVFEYLPVARAVARRKGEGGLS